MVIITEGVPWHGMAQHCNEGTAMISGLRTSPIHFPGFEKSQLFHLRADLPTSWLFLGYFLNTHVVRIEIRAFLKITFSLGKC